MKNSINFVTVPMNNNYTHQHLPCPADYYTGGYNSRSSKKGEDNNDRYESNGDCYFLQINGKDESSLDKKQSLKS